MLVWMLKTTPGPAPGKRWCPVGPDENMQGGETVTRLEKVMEKKEELKKLLLEDYCPSDFGVEDRHDGEKYCDPATRNCEACWNEEID